MNNFTNFSRMGHSRSLLDSWHHQLYFEYFKHQVHIQAHIINNDGFLAYIYRGHDIALPIFIGLVI